MATPTCNPPGQCRLWYPAPANSMSTACNDGKDTNECPILSPHERKETIMNRQVDGIYRKGDLIALPYKKGMIKGER